MSIVTMVEIGHESDSEFVPGVCGVPAEMVESRVGGWLIAVSQFNREGESLPVVIDRKQEGDTIVYVAYQGPYVPGLPATFISSLTIVGDLPFGVV